MPVKSINFGKKSELTVDVYVDISDPEYLRTLTDQEELELLKPETPLPDHIIKVTSKWARNSFLLGQIIELNSYVDRLVQGRIQRITDTSCYTTAQVRVLLKEWNLQEFDERFKLKLEPCRDNMKVMILSDETMVALGELTPPDVLYRSLNKAIIADALPKKLRDKKGE